MDSFLSDGASRLQRGLVEQFDREREKLVADLARAGDDLAKADIQRKMQELERDFTRRTCGLDRMLY